MPFCIVCGKQIDKEATFCSSCGARQKSAPAEALNQTVPNASRSRLSSFFIAVGAAVAITLVISLLIGSNSHDSSNTSSTQTASTSIPQDNESGKSTKSEGPKMALIGNRGVAELGPVLACPEWKDYEQVIADIVRHDDTGKVQDFRQGGCTVIKKGDTGLIIDAGFTSVRVRLDKDQAAYWTESSFGDPLRPLFVCVSGSKCGP